MSPEGPARVFTIGYDGKQPAEILEALSEHAIHRLIDVRAIAESSKEGFSADELMGPLAELDIGYIHMGELGDFQPEPYKDYMETSEWQEAYERLLDHVSEGVSCLLCACADVSSCHRRFLAMRLREDGARVVHLTPAGPKEAVTFEQGA